MSERPTYFGLDLPTQVRRELYAHTWWASPIQTICLLGGYVTLSIVGLTCNSWLLYPLVWTLQGFILSCFLGASHDCAHSTYSARRPVNRVAGVLWSSAILFNFTLYKAYHLEHHRSTAIEGDTEPRGQFHSILEYVTCVPALGFFTSFWKMSFGLTGGKYPHFIRGNQERRAAVVDNWILAGWVGITIAYSIVSPWFMLKAYWMPLLFFFPMVFFTSLPEHYGCSLTDNPLSNTRSVLSNAAFRFLFWNGNFHAEHHALPGVPSWNLIKLHRLIGHRFENREVSYLRFHVALVTALIQRRPFVRQTDRKWTSQVHYSSSNRTDES